MANAQAHDDRARVPFVIGASTVGSVARAHLAALQRWPGLLAAGADRVALTAPAAERDAALAEINHGLCREGLILAWRDETYAIVDLATRERLACTERAASRFWGTLTLGAHATGYVADDAGRPSHLWIARRSLRKATDPGMFDNLIGGGVADGQSPLEALIREGWEEAGLSPAQMAAARPCGVMRVQRDIPQGLQLEDVHSFDLALPPGLVPVNQDGEVERFDLLPVAEALALAAGTLMTVDAALVTLDFARRHGLLRPPFAKPDGRAQMP